MHFSNLDFFKLNFFRIGFFKRGFLKNECLRALMPTAPPPPTATTDDDGRRTTADDEKAPAKSKNSFPDPSQPDQPQPYDKKPTGNGDDPRRWEPIQMASCHMYEVIVVEVFSNN